MLRIAVPIRNPPPRRATACQPSRTPTSMTRLAIATSTSCSSVYAANSGSGAERLCEVGDDVVRVLDPHGCAHRAWADPQGRPLLGGHRTVRRDLRVGDRRLHSTQAGREGDELEAADHPLHGVSPAN